MGANNNIHALLNFDPDFLGTHVQALVGIKMECPGGILGETSRESQGLRELPSRSRGLAVVNILVKCSQLNAERTNGRSHHMRPVAGCPGPIQGVSFSRTSDEGRNDLLSALGIHEGPWYSTPPPQSVRFLFF